MAYRNDKDRVVGPENAAKGQETTSPHKPQVTVRRSWHERQMRKITYKILHGILDGCKDGIDYADEYLKVWAGIKADVEDVTDIVPVVEQG